MVARKKIVPPVTPRIVQAQPKQRLLGFLLLIGVFLLTAWFSYDYGRTHQSVSGGVPVAQTGESDQRIAALEQERDTLKQQVSELELSVEQVNRALEAAQIRIHALQRTESQARKTPAPKPAQAPAGTDPDAVDNTLALENARIEATGSENTFRVRFSVMHGGDSGGRVTGTIWIAVNGFSNGDPKRLSFKVLSPNPRTYVKMGFDQQQDVSEDLVLPEDFRPKNILIEAKPYGDKYVGTTLKLPWDTSG